MNSLLKKISWFWCAFLAVFGFLRLSLAGQAPHGGALIEHEGTQFEVVTLPEQHRFQVFTPLDWADSHSRMTLKLKQKGRPTLKVNLKLNETTPESAVYSGLIPSGVLVSGGIRFEISGSKK